MNRGSTVTPEQPCHVAISDAEQPDRGRQFAGLDVESEQRGFRCGDCLERDSRFFVALLTIAHVVSFSPRS
jgi:hypothetical protein